MSTTTTTPLADARDRIDEIDRRFVELLAERYAVVDEICEMKAQSGDTVKDHDREAELFDHVSSIAEANDLSPALVRRLYETILSHSVQRQRSRRDDADADASGPADAPDSDSSPNAAPNGSASNGTAASVPDAPPSSSDDGASGAGDRAAPAPASTAESLSRPADADPDQRYHEVARDESRGDTVIPVGDAEIGGDRPVLIAGPCSVESREQILRAAEAVAEAGGHLLRGGCFKPRTSPYSFQGLGAEGLDLLAEAGRRFDLPVITEVLAPGDVAAVAARADVLQIGARNMQNFPLLKAAGRADRPVMLKRGMMATVEEWLAAAEYVVGHGNPDVFLCERGIQTFADATRYTLDLSSVPVARERTHLPVVVDPSHAAGTRRWVPPLVRAALGAGADGVMVEAHPNPDAALSDGPQSLSLDTLPSVARAVRQAAA
jgi:3-deoxy-7-phosphoheptulonate synthase